MQKRGVQNLHDPYAVAAMNHNVVGHVSKSLSAICSILRRGGVIFCKITGTRQYSLDLYTSGWVCTTMQA